MYLYNPPIDWYLGCFQSFFVTKRCQEYPCTYIILPLARFARKKVLEFEYIHFNFDIFKNLYGDCTKVHLHWQHMRALGLSRCTQQVGPSLYLRPSDRWKIKSRTLNFLKRMRLFFSRWRAICISSSVNFIFLPHIFFRTRLLIFLTLICKSAVIWKAALCPL